MRLNCKMSFLYKVTLWNIKKELGDVKSNWGYKVRTLLYEDKIFLFSQFVIYKDKTVRYKLKLELWNYEMYNKVGRYKVEKSQKTGS